MSGNQVFATMLRAQDDMSVYRALVEYEELYVYDAAFRPEVIIVRAEMARRDAEVVAAAEQITKEADEQ